MECNSKNTSDANGVHLEVITFLYKCLKTVLQFCFTCFPSFFLDVLIIGFCFETVKSRAIF